MLETTTTQSSRQLEELHLLSCSLLPGESISFSPSLEDAQVWASLLESYPEIDPAQLPTTPARFLVRLDDSDIWYEVQMPVACDNETIKPIILVKGAHLTRDEQAHWQAIVTQRIQELVDSELEYPMYEVVSAQLLPLLHARIALPKAAGPANYESLPGGGRAELVQERYHALFTSHHLISPTKRRNLQLWSSQFDISGFAKVGYPGIIYAEGPKDNVEDFVRRVKAMQWLALRVRFVEPAPSNSDSTSRTWREFEKVGEVVAEMRRMGRENYVVEMGIGSTSTR